MKKKIIRKIKSKTRVKKRARQKAIRRVKLAVKVLSSRSRRIRISREANRQFAPVLSPFAKPARRILFKLAALALVVSMNGLALSRVGDTMGYYNDIEAASGNSFSAASLAFDIIPNTHTSGISASYSPNFVFLVNNTGSHFPEYRVTVVTSSTCDNGFWNGLDINLSGPNGLSYTGALSSMSALTGDAHGLWTAAVSTNPSISGITLGEACDFSLLFEAYQASLGYDNGGYTASSTSDFKLISTLDLSLGNVVINEIMWMGSHTPPSANTSDEWIELRNMTATDIDLAGWTITNLGTEPSPIITIPSGTIPAGGYFLISNHPVTSSGIADSIVVDYQTTGIQLLNSGEVLTLKNNSGTKIDETPTGTWAAGSNTGSLRKSMERNNIPGDGTTTSSWHTCIDDFCNDTTYWDVEGDNYGTPKANNLSENDPTLPDYIDQDWSYTVSWQPDENDYIDDSESVPETLAASGGSSEFEVLEVTVPEADMLEGDTSEEGASTDSTTSTSSGQDSSTEAILEEEVMPEAEPVEPVVEADSTSSPQAETPAVIEETPVIVEESVPTEPASSE